METRGDMVPDGYLLLMTYHYIQYYTHVLYKLSIISSTNDSGSALIRSNIVLLGATSHQLGCCLRCWNTQRKCPECPTFGCDVVVQSVGSHS
jgi:hypothetical protein